MPISRSILCQLDFRGCQCHSLLHPAGHVRSVTVAALLYGKNLGREAEQVLRRGIHANPQTLSLKLTLSRLLEQSGQPEAALAVLRAEPDGEHTDATIRFYAMRGALAQQLDNRPLARSSYLWLTGHVPDDGRWWLGLALTEEKAGHQAAAVAAYQSAPENGHLSRQSVSFVRTQLGVLQATPEDTHSD